MPSVFLTMPTEKVTFMLRATSVSLSLASP